MEEYRLKRAKELCRHCRCWGIPPYRYFGGGRYYSHSFLDAAGSKDFEICAADKFLKNLDFFTGKDGAEWAS